MNELIGILIGCAIFLFVLWPMDLIGRHKCTMRDAYGCVFAFVLWSVGIRVKE